MQIGHAGVGVNYITQQKQAQAEIANLTAPNSLESKLMSPAELRKNLQASHFDLGFEYGTGKSSNAEHFSAPQTSLDTQ